MLIMNDPIPTGLGMLVQGEQIPVALLQELNGGAKPWVVAVAYPTIDVPGLIKFYGGEKLALVTLNMADHRKYADLVEWPVFLNEPDIVTQGNRDPDEYAACVRALRADGYKVVYPNASGVGGPWMSRFAVNMALRGPVALHGYRQPWWTLPRTYGGQNLPIVYTELYPQDKNGLQLPLSPLTGTPEFTVWEQQVAEFWIAVHASGLCAAPMQVPDDGRGTPSLATKASGVWELNAIGKAVAAALAPVAVAT